MDITLYVLFVGLFLGATAGGLIEYLLKQILPDNPTPRHIVAVVVALIFIAIFYAWIMTRENEQGDAIAVNASSTSTSMFQPTSNSTNPVSTMLLTSVPTSVDVSALSTTVVILSPTPIPPPTPDPGLLPPNAFLGDSWLRTVDGMLMVYVPGGTFQMGITETQLEIALAQCKYLYSDEDCQLAEFGDQSIRQTVKLDAFWIDRTEVTYGQYAGCVADRKCEPLESAKKDELDDGIYPDAVETHPVVNVSWEDATNYCTWAGGWLPSEAQWEFAARGLEGYIYTWGNEFGSEYHNFCDINCPYEWKVEGYDDGYIFTAPVGSYPTAISWVGAYDMLGNVWEWVSNSDFSAITGNYLDTVREAFGNKISGQTSSNTVTFKVVRGGSWKNPLYLTLTTTRAAINPTYRYDGVGFRCVVIPGS